MNKYFIISLIYLIPIAGLINCSLPPNQQTGRIKIAFTFPKQGNNFTIKKIPLETNAFIVSISGTAMSLTKTKVTRDQVIRYFDVPSGEKIVTVDAIDINNKILATDTKTIKVISYITNSVTLDLVSPKNIIVLPDPTVTQNPTVIVKPTPTNVQDIKETPNPNGSPDPSPSPSPDNNSNGSNSGNSSNSNSGSSSGNGGSSNSPSVNVDIIVSPDDSEIESID